METFVETEKKSASNIAIPDNLHLSQAGTLASSFHVHEELSFPKSLRSPFDNVGHRLPENDTGFSRTTAHEVFDSGTIVKSRGQEFGIFFEGETLRTWKLVQNIPSQIVSYDDHEIVVECLVDRESRTYQERTFSRDIFEGYKLFETKKFLIQVYERSGGMKLEILDKDGLVSADDFPQVNFEKLFGNIDAFKKSKKS